MKNNKTFFILLAVFVAVLVGAWLLYDNLGSQFGSASLATQDTTAPEATASASSMAPDFTVTDRDGKEVDLYDFHGKPIIVNFWASWCGPCKSEMPDIEAAYQAYGEDIHFLIINLTDGSRETVASAASYIQQEGYTFPVYYDTTTEAATTYHAYSIPTTYFIDAAGNGVAYYTGAMSSAILQQGIDMILP